VPVGTPTAVTTASSSTPTAFSAFCAALTAFAAEVLFVAVRTLMTGLPSSSRVVLTTRTGCCVETVVGSNWSGVSLRP
jgi:hypothetical protein